MAEGEQIGKESWALLCLLPTTYPGHSCPSLCRLMSPDAPSVDGNLGAFCDGWVPASFLQWEWQ